MAKQVPPLFLECTWDNLTFYKMDGKYYARKKSRLTREKVLTHPDFANTRFYANRLAAASKIASAIYRQLPIDWRQFWMFRDFTGEAFSLMEYEDATPQEAYDYLWETYVEYWVLYQKTTGIPLQTGRKKQPPRRRKTYKTRIKHRTENPKCRRYLRLIGRNHWKSSYDNTAELLEKERRRLAREQKEQWIAEQRAKGRWREEEERWQQMLEASLKPGGHWNQEDLSADLTAGLATDSAAEALAKAAALTKEATQWRLVQAALIKPPDCCEATKPALLSPA